MSKLADRMQRPLLDLRVSVTDRCNLRCPYCMPREVYGPGFEFLPSQALLSFEEIAAVAKACACHGVRKVRLTGGEPLLRPGLPRLVELLRAIDGIEEVALTTNGLLLGRHAASLADAGLTRVTVSLDALDEHMLAKMNGVGDVDVASSRRQRILEGIDAAEAVGLAPIKVNMVVKRGVNERCIPEMAAHFRNSGHVLRFIEYMDVGSSNGWREQDVLGAKHILAAVQERWPLQPLPSQRQGEVARRYRYLDGAGEIGVIASVSKPFCGQCVRARLSADGKLFTCLFATAGRDLKAVLRGGGGEQELAETIATIWGERDDRYSATRSLERDRGKHAPQALPHSPHSEAVLEKVEMSYIGG